MPKGLLSDSYVRLVPFGELRRAQRAPLAFAPSGRQRSGIEKEGAF